MIRTIGFNKFLIIALLAGFIVIAFLYKSQMVQPALDKQERELRKEKREISEMTKDMNKLVKGMEEFDKQKDQFANVQKLGFFDPQNRVVAKQRIIAMQQESRLLSARYTISPAQTVPNEKAKDAGYKILNTDIDFSLGAIEDADVYKFIYLLNYGFPGQLIIRDVKLERKKEITQPLLRQIGVGEAEPVITATITASWKTMVPDDSLAVSNEGAR